MFSFMGVPYAVPLQGTDRWTHSKPMTNLAECHEGTFKAHSRNLVRPRTKNKGFLDSLSKTR